MASRLSTLDQSTHKETARYSYGTLRIQMIKASGLCTANYGALQSRVAGSEYVAEPYVAVQMQFKGARFGEEKASAVAPQYFTSRRTMTTTTMRTTVKRELASPIWALWSPSPAATTGLAARRNSMRSIKEGKEGKMAGTQRRQSLGGGGKAAQTDPKALHRASSLARDAKTLRRASSLDIAWGGDGTGSTQFYPDPPRIVGGSVHMCDELGAGGELAFSFSSGAATEIVFEIRAKRGDRGNLLGQDHLIGTGVFELSRCALRPPP
jgi:hypothetical protein